MQETGVKLPCAAVKTASGGASAPVTVYTKPAGKPAVEGMPRLPAEQPWLVC